MGVTVTTSGSFSDTERWLKNLQKFNFRKKIEPIVQAGVASLETATPRDSGLAANSWGYEIEEGKGYLTIYWTNNDIENGFPVALMIQYGHGTKNGGYVQGRDYINPAIRPIFDRIADEVMRVVNSA